MPLVPAICTQCGSPIEVDNAKEAGICPHCGTAFITEKVVNNYVTNHVSNTTVSQTIVKNIYGREKTEAEEYVARGLSFLGLGEYLEAAKCFQSAVNSEPGNIENHILLYRALTIDFRLYYGGLTDPERQGHAFAFPLNERDKTQKTSLNDVFDRIDKLAAQQDISALQKQYGYSFRKDKNFWLKSYRNATRLYSAILDEKPDETSQLLEKALGVTPSVFNVRADYRRFDRCAAYAIEKLYACSDFSEDEREAFFEEYRKDYTDERLREMNMVAKAQAEFFGREPTLKNEPKGVLTVLTYKMFPCRDGVYDLTGYGGAVIPTDTWPNDKTLPDLRVSIKNIRSAKLQNQETIARIEAKTCIIAAEETICADDARVECEILKFEEGIAEIRNATGLPAFMFWEISFPSTLKKIGEFLFDHTLKVRTKPPEKPIVFPKGLEYIGEQAFGKSEYSLSVVVLPESLKTVGKLPFGNICPSRLICLCDTTAWSKDWCTYVEKSLYSKENELRSYTYLDVPNNIFQYKFSVTSNDIERLKKELQSYKGFADFDENKTKFVGPKPTKGTPDSSNAQKKKGCYIATAVYGSYDCPQVWTLRRYRDFSLRRSAPGRLFVKLYYAVSPTLVKLFGKQKWFCSLWKRALDKKIKKLNAQGFANTPYDDQ